MTHTIDTIAIGLRVSLIVLLAMTFFRVLFRWKINANVPASDLDKSGKYWRFAWGAWCLGMVTLSLDHLASITDSFHPVARLLAAVTGSAVLNFGAIMGELGFKVGRGERHGSFWPYVIMPFAFVALAFLL